MHEPITIIQDSPDSLAKSGPTKPARSVRLWARLLDDRGAIAIEYVIVALALLAVAAAVAAALTTLANDAVEQLPTSVSDVG